MPAHSMPPEANVSNAIWYLGIDFGTTAVSAVVLNYSTGQRSPVYWSHPIPNTPEPLGTVNAQFTPPSSGEAIFRLPAVTYSDTVAGNLSVDLPTQKVVGSSASTLGNNQPGVFLEHVKPYLNGGIPFYCPKRHEWEPTLHLPGEQQVSLYEIRRSVQALLATLTPPSDRSQAMIQVEAEGLESETLTMVLQQLEGVILGYPAAWGDTYRFNLREAVLQAKLVKFPEQIFFLEDAIASVLAIFPTSKAEALESGGVGEWERFSTPMGELSHKPSPPPPIPPSSSSPSSLTYQRGATLVINAGATTTELALVNLPDDLDELTYSDFSLCSLPYAGNAIDQDIFGQLLYPQLSLEQRQQLSRDDLELPHPGEPDQQRRDRLALQLQRSPLGQALLKASGYIKVIVQHKEKFTLELGKQKERWVLKRLDLETHVVQPFIQQLHQKLNALVIESGILEPAISQVFLLGGTAHLSSLAKWIQQRLPNATVIQDADSLSRNWVATGLATLPLYPNVLNRLRHQYSDYFLLLELLRAFGETTGESATRPYRLEEIMQQLERRGLNTDACYERLVRLVESQLPDGLIPSLGDDSLLSSTSKQNPLYWQVAANTGLFSRDDNQLYHRNLQQQEYLRQYLELILADTYQKFEEPLLVTWNTR